MQRRVLVFLVGGLGVEDCLQPVFFFSAIALSMGNVTEDAVCEVVKAQFARQA